MGQSNSSDNNSKRPLQTQPNLGQSYAYSLHSNTGHDAVVSPKPCSEIRQTQPSTSRELTKTGIQPRPVQVVSPKSYPVLGLPVQRPSTTKVSSIHGSEVKMAAVRAPTAASRSGTPVVDVKPGPAKVPVALNETPLVSTSARPFPLLLGLPVQPPSTTKVSSIHGPEVKMAATRAPTAVSRLGTPVVDVKPVLGLPVQPPSTTKVSSIHGPEVKMAATPAPTAASRSGTPLVNVKPGPVKIPVPLNETPPVSTLARPFPLVLGLPGQPPSTTKVSSIHGPEVKMAATRVPTAVSRSGTPLVNVKPGPVKVPVPLNETPPVSTSARPFPLDHQSSANKQRYNPVQRGRHENAHIGALRGQRSRSPSAENWRARGRGGKRGGKNRGGAAGQQCRYFGFKMLEELLGKGSEEVCMQLIANREALINYITQNELSPDVMVLIVEVAAMVLTTAFTEVIGQLLLMLTKADFFVHVEAYIMRMPLEDSAMKNRGRRFWNAPDQFFANLAQVLNAMIETVPATALDVIPHLLKAIQYTMPNIENAHRLQFAEHVHKAFEDLAAKMALLVTRKENVQKRKELKDDDDEADLVPAEDFHEIDIYPTVGEITQPTDTFLRKNVVRGAYRDVHHYLDVHFRLLREDFVAPLRAGICEYLKDPQSKRISNVKIHKHALYLGIVPNPKQAGCLMQVFKPKSIRNLEHSRRFMFGSLVCLTSDNFRTVIFGKIVDRDDKLLKLGQLVLGFDVGVQLQLNLPYLLVECSIYFEPYYQVLNAIKHIDEERFPMKEYLVDVQTDTVIPAYLANVDGAAIGKYIRNLNASQEEAFRGVLTKQFCIIQGPPGTGKTYLGLQIARFLLNYAKMDGNPILVICYTNHALDQFLEGLLTKTTDLVRVGGQSRNERLTKYNIKNIKVKSAPPECYRAQRAMMMELHVAKKRMSERATLLTLLNDFSHVVSFDRFFQCDIKLGMWFAEATSQDILQWLLHQPQNSSSEYQDMRQATQMIRAMEAFEKSQENQTSLTGGEGINTEDDPHLNPHLLFDEDEDPELIIDYELKDDEFLFSCPDAYKLICKLTTARNEVLANEGEMSMAFWRLTQQLLKLRLDYKYVCERMEEIRALGDELPPFYIDYDDPHTMAPRNRWLAYAQWVRQLRATLLEEYTEMDHEYRKMYMETEELREMRDLYKLREADVVGITTTGAARLHKTLQVLAPKVVIVEEAAEVLEAHIVTALSSKCEHLILIGDHKQLKPSTADYAITTEFRLGVSLFERMVSNGLHCHTLNVQHRMRPEIANLVCPSIYPTLLNHESVRGYPAVQGIDSPLYFITHSERETESNDRSKENAHEANYLIRLARHLVLNGYAPERITIISAYSGQWFLMRKIKATYQALSQVRICVLDNYQGEENDIILLSLVRNNAENMNGFLELENRICVALSRAKIGMYIMGNMDQLCSRNKIWPQVRDVLQKYNAIGPALSVRCVNHPDEVTLIRKIDDFDQVPEGGCLRPCGQTLDCGHICVKLCHSTAHDNYKCHQPCRRIICELGHLCPLSCYVECRKCEVPKRSTLPCGHTLDIPCYLTPEEFQCPVTVSTTLPCQHLADKPCHANTETFRCPHPCTTRIEPCGHACMQTCHIRRDPHHEKYRCQKQCARPNADCSMGEEQAHICKKLCGDACVPCPVIVKKQRECQHFYELACHVDVETIDCMKKCKRKMPCGHNCNNECKVACGPCDVQVPKTIAACGHSVNWECGEEPRKVNCKAMECQSILKCGHQCPLPCAADCTTAKCAILVPYVLQPSPCGHELQVLCHMRNQTTINNELLAHCTAKCEETLRCGHICVGTCGSCSQGRIHERCGQKCEKTLICGHPCSTPCMEACQPCAKQCDSECEHSKCSKKCGVPCTDCKEPCNRRCEHQKCKARCGAICTVPPCNEPCPRTLACGHDCIGYCGDVCPPFCRVCDKDEVTTIFFGNEDEPGARFVYLPQCKHLVEAGALEQWFGINSGAREIAMPTCPKCKTPVHLLRFKHLIFDACKDIQKIKASYFGHPKEIKELKGALLADIKTLQIPARPFQYNMNVSAIDYFTKAMRTTVSARERKDHSKPRLVAIKVQLDLFKEFLKRRVETGQHEVQLPGMLRNTTKCYEMVNEYFRFVKRRLLSDAFVANQQQIDDFQLELMRFNRISQLTRICVRLPQCIHSPEYSQVIRILCNFQRYDTKLDSEAKNLLQKLSTSAKLTDVERKQIVAAMGFAPGHWFKCKNGHIYSIGECGGAMEEGKCPECGLQIGGTQHTLVAGNRLASEMDNATQPAYPTLNNLDLYDLEH